MNKNNINNMIPKVHQTEMFINNELEKYQDETYWGSEENINKEKELINYLLKNKIINETWLDDHESYTNEEWLKEILKLLK